MIIIYFIIFLFIKQQNSQIIVYFLFNFQTFNQEFLNYTPNSQVFFVSLQFSNTFFITVSFHLIIIVIAIFIFITAIIINRFNARLRVEIVIFIIIIKYNLKNYCYLN